MNIEVGNGDATPLRPDSPQAWLQAAGKFEDAMREHLDEIYADRRKQREIAENEDSGLINGE